MKGKWIINLLLAEAIMRKFLLLLVVCLGLVGCTNASSYMQPIGSEVAVVQPPIEETHVVFVRTTTFGAGVQAPVIEANDGKLSFVAIISAKMKFLHVTTPGEHTYLVGGEGGDITTANFDGGKTYYVSVTPHLGMWKARFTLDPVSKESAEGESFKKDFAWCEWYKNGQTVQNWFRENLPSITDKYNDGMKNYNAKPMEKRHIIKPEYGLDIPLR